MPRNQTSYANVVKYGRDAFNIYNYESDSDDYAEADDYYTSEDYLDSVVKIAHDNFEDVLDDINERGKHRSQHDEVVQSIKNNPTNYLKATRPVVIQAIPEAPGHLNNYLYNQENQRYVNHYDGKASYQNLRRYLWDNLPLAAKLNMFFNEEDMSADDSSMKMQFQIHRLEQARDTNYVFTSDSEVDGALLDLESARDDRFQERWQSLLQQRSGLALEFKGLLQITSQLGDEYKKFNQRLYKAGSFFSARSDQPSEQRLEAIARIQEVAEAVNFDLGDCDEYDSNLKIEHQVFKLRDAISTLKGGALAEYNTIKDTYRVSSASNSALFQCINNAFGCSSMSEAAQVVALENFATHQAQQQKFDGQERVDVDGIECLKTGGGLAFTV